MPIEHKSLSLLVYEQIRGEILNGKLAPGIRVKQEEFTRKLGVSRTPVREAFRRLEAEGLIHSVGRNAPVVASIPPQRIHEIFELRELLESFAAVQASRHLPDDAIAKLRALIAEMGSCHSKQQIKKLLLKNEEFHAFICYLSGNERLLRFLEQIWADMRRLRLEYLITPEGHAASTREHKRLVDAIESHDEALIRKTVSEHTRRTMAGILQVLNRPPDHKAPGTS